MTRSIVLLNLMEDWESCPHHLPYPNLPTEVMLVVPFDSPESSLEKEAKFFIEEKDDLGETIDLPKEEVPTRPPVELKPLPEGLRYAFLNDDENTPIIISDKLNDKEMLKGPCVVLVIE